MESKNALHDFFLPAPTPARTSSWLIGTSSSYRQNARRDYLSVAKQKRPGRKKIRKAIGQQLRYLRRNLGHIDSLLDCDALLLSLLSRANYKCLLVIRTLYEQQLHMYETRSHKVPGRIVSIRPTPASQSLNHTRVHETLFQEALNTHLSRRRML